MLNAATNGVGRVPSKTSREKPIRQVQDFADKPVTAGPWGGEGGLSWDDEVHAGIRQIIISSGTAIDSILIEYDDGRQSKRSGRHGGSGGAETDKIRFDYPKEILLSIHGYFGAFYTNGPSAVRSLTFCTNLRQYGPFGVEEGTFFESPQPASRIVGFHGRSGLFLDAIGVYTRLSFHSSGGNNKFDTSMLLPRVVSAVRDIAEAVATTPQNLKVSQLKPVPGGPWGGRGGNPWDDGVYSGIRQIIVGFGSVIDNIKVEYVRNGQSVWSARHGGNGGSRTATVKFDYPNEVLTSISGHYGHFGQNNVLTVRSLTFHTNYKKYGPFGDEKGTYFASPSTKCKILGFNGRSGWYLDAIGVHLVMENSGDEETGEEVENAWTEFVSRIIHHNTGNGGI